MKKILEIESLTVEIRSATPGKNGAVLRGIDLEMVEGEKLALVGESGCGKSMLALSILNLLPRPPMSRTGGRISFMGMDLDAFREDQWLDLRGKRIGIVFQEPLTSLNPVLTIGRQLEEGMVLHLGIPPSEARRRALDLLAEVGIADAERISRQFPHQLSGGMCQRVMIAMAISCGPELLIADEPTTALDVTVQLQILELLSEMTRKHKASILLITHDLRIVRRFSDRIAIVYFGQVVEKGRTEEILGNPAHPYTQGLLGALPRSVGDKGRLASIPGSVPSPFAWMEGCAFAERCPKADGKCRASQPPAVEVGKGHTALCFYPSKG